MFVPLMKKKLFIYNGVKIFLILFDCFSLEVIIDRRIVLIKMAILLQ